MLESIENIAGDELDDQAKKLFKANLKNGAAKAYSTAFGNIGKDKEAYYKYRDTIYNKKYYPYLDNKFSSIALYYFANISLI